MTLAAVGLCSILYAPGAFFFYPWKPLIQLAVGDSYASAYRHFQRDHSDLTNVLLHCVASHTSEKLS